MPDKRVHPSNRSLVLLLVISCLHMCMNAFRLTNAHTGIIIQRPSSMRYYTNAHTGIMQQHTTPHIRVGDTPETCHMLARNPQTHTHTHTHAHTHTHTHTHTQVELGDADGNALRRARSTESELQVLRAANEVLAVCVCVCVCVYDM